MAIGTAEHIEQYHRSTETQHQGSMWPPPNKHYNINYMAVTKQIVLYLAAENHSQSPSIYILLVVDKPWSVQSHWASASMPTNAIIKPPGTWSGNTGKVEKSSSTTIQLTEERRRLFGGVGISHT